MTNQERVWVALATGGLTKAEIMERAGLDYIEAQSALHQMRLRFFICTTGRTHGAKWYRTPGAKYAGDQRGTKPRSRANLNAQAKQRSRVVPALTWEALL